MEVSTYDHALQPMTYRYHSVEKRDIVVSETSTYFVTDTGIRTVPASSGPEVITVEYPIETWKVIVSTLQATSASPLDTISTTVPTTESPPFSFTTQTPASVFTTTLFGTSSYSLSTPISSTSTHHGSTDSVAPIDTQGTDTSTTKSSMSSPAGSSNVTHSETPLPTARSPVDLRNDKWIIAVIVLAVTVVLLLGTALIWRMQKSYPRRSVKSLNFRPLGKPYCNPLAITWYSLGLRWKFR